MPAQIQHNSDSANLPLSALPLSVHYRPLNPPKYIAGTRTGKTDGIAGVERVFDFFIGGCDFNTTEDNILSHCAFNDVVLK